MNPPERALLDRLLARLELLQVSLAEDVTLLDDVPTDRAMFEALPPHRRSASRAVLKSFEQIEDQLARAFRAIPVLVGENTKRWFARDHADYMERVGVLDDAARWSAIVRLRNELVHDYPLDADVQFRRFLQVIAALPDLASAQQRLALFVQNDLPDHMI